MSDETIAVSSGTVVIARDSCKGCDLCVPACPPRVLSMSRDLNAIGFRYPLLSAGCTGCAVCQKVCPDSVFEVWRYTTPASHPPGSQQGEIAP